MFYVTVLAVLFSIINTAISEEYVYVKTTIPSGTRLLCKDFPDIKNDPCSKRDYKVPEYATKEKVVQGVFNIVKNLKQYQSSIGKSCVEKLIDAVCKVSFPACTKDQKHIVSFITKQQCDADLKCLHPELIARYAGDGCNPAPDETAMKIKVSDAFGTTLVDPTKTSGGEAKTQATSTSDIRTSQPTPTSNKQTTQAIPKIQDNLTSQPTPTSDKQTTTQATSTSDNRTSQPTPTSDKQTATQAIPKTSDNRTNQPTPTSDKRTTQGAPTSGNRAASRDRVSKIYLFVFLPFLNLLSSWM